MENKLKLLIIDDDKAIRNSYSLMFNKYFVVDCSGTIKDAIKKLSTNNYSVAIIDMAFPEDPAGGLQIISYISNNKINTKGIVLTAFGSEVNFKKSYEQGIFDFVEKGTPGANDILIHSCLYAASLPPEVRIFLSDETIEYFRQMEESLKLSKIDIIGEGLRILHWAIQEWKGGNEIGSVYNGKVKKIEVVVR